MDKKEDAKESYAFHFLNDVEHPVVRLNAAGKETRSNGSYYWDNRSRQESYLFQYTLNGSGTVKIDGEMETIGKGKGFFLKMPGPECYYFDAERNEAPWEFIYILFECDGAQEYCRHIEEHLGRIIELPLYSPPVDILFDIYAQAERQNQSPFLLGSMVFSFLCSLCSMKKEKEKVGSALVAKAKAYMEREFTQQVGICDVAAACSVSQSHLSREFYKTTGMKPVEYMTKLRLKKAVDMLSETSVQISEVSSSCGFSSTNYFQKVFRKHMGMPPAQFRRYVQSEGYLRFQI